MSCDASPDLPLRTVPGRDRLLAWGVLAIGLLSRAPFIAADEGWFDEFFSLTTAQLNPREILEVSLNELTNPPGHYLLLHLWGLLGDTSLTWQRWPSVIAGAIAPAALFVAVRRLGLSAWAALAAAAAALTSPLLWTMSLEARAYAPSAALAAVAISMAAGTVRRDAPPSRRSIAALAVLNLVMVSLHFFAAFAVAGIALAVAVATPAPGSRWRRATIAIALGAPAALATLAWLMVAYLGFNGMQGRNIAWIPALGITEALRTAANATFAHMGSRGETVSACLLMAAVAVAAQRLRRSEEERLRERRIATFVAIAGLLPIALALAAHLLRGERLWVARYLTVLVPGLTLLPALAIDAAQPRSRRFVAISCMAWWTFSGALRFLERPPKPDWSGIVAALAPDGHATICASELFVGLPLLVTAHHSGASNVNVVGRDQCAAAGLPTWVVYDPDRNTDLSAFTRGDLTLGTHVVLSRGLQNIDARRLVPRDDAP